LLSATTISRQRGAFIYQTNGDFRVSDERLIGRIKHVSPRGFFFLTCEDRTGDVFGHARDFRAATGLGLPEVGERYSFRVVEWQDKEKAVDFEVVQ
jgi:cold shock CspA family protein